MGHLNMSSDMQVTLELFHICASWKNPWPPRELSEVAFSVEGIDIPCRAKDMGKP
jgi:hypothetical protein